MDKIIAFLQFTVTLLFSLERLTEEKHACWYKILLMIQPRLLQFLIQRLTVAMQIKDCLGLIFSLILQKVRV